VYHPYTTLTCVYVTLANMTEQQCSWELTFVALFSWARNTTTSSRRWGCWNSRQRTKTRRYTTWRNSCDHCSRLIANCTASLWKASADSLRFHGGSTMTATNTFLKDGMTVNSPWIWRFLYAVSFSRFHCCGRCSHHGIGPFHSEIMTDQRLFVSEWV